jgi:hypothetical protein
MQGWRPITLQTIKEVTRILGGLGRRSKGGAPATPRERRSCTPRAVEENKAYDTLLVDFLSLLYNNCKLLITNHHPRHHPMKSADRRSRSVLGRDRPAKS